ncbi:MAG: hypothetical protein QG597_3348 [Actinomycetota bacterium]|nr:hypothetical protein [Actinomycetota bacterium]
MGIVWTIIGALFAGIIIGPLGRLVVPGKQDISLIMTIVVGAVGALVGGFVATLIGVGDTSGIDWIKLGIQVVVAAICVVLYVKFAGNKSSTPTA